MSERRSGRAGPTAYWRQGAGETLVFVHGVGMSKAVWAPQLASFGARHDVLAYDMLGHGESALSPGAASLADFIAQLGRLLAALGIAEASLIGHSMGALVALGYALDHPERVRRVVALNAVYDRSPAQRAAVLARAADVERDGLGASTAPTLARWFGDPIDPALAPVARQVGGWLETIDPRGYARAYRVFAESDRAHVGRLGALAMPVLYLTGTLDPNSTPAMSERMAAATPRGHALALPGERHMMALAAPARVNAVLQDFLAEPVG